MSPRGALEQKHTHFFHTFVLLVWALLHVTFAIKSLQHNINRGRVLPAAEKEVLCHIRSQSSINVTAVWVTDC